MRNFLPLFLSLAIVLLMATENSISTKGGLTTKERKEAEKIYNSRCNTCHRLYDPAGYSEDEWKLWMAKMVCKAKLDENQRQLLNRYLDNFRAQTESGK